MRRIVDRDQEVLDRARLEVEHYGEQFKIALAEKWSMGAVLNHKIWLANALVILGDYEEARRIAEFEPGVVRVKDKPKLKKLREEVDEMEAAVEEDDDAYCNCVHIVDLNPAITGQSLPRELSSYSPTGRKTKSKKHGGKLVELYKCIYCGHTNALPAPPDQMLVVANQLRKTANNLARISIAKKQSPLPDFTVADHHHYAKTEAPSL